MANKNNNYKKELVNQIKSYSIINGPFIVALLFLFVEIPLKLEFLRTILIWIAFLTSSILIIVMKEYPRLPPYKSVTGRNATIIGYVFFSIILVLGILYMVLKYVYPL